MSVPQPLINGRRIALAKLQPCTMPVVHADNPQKVKSVCGKQSEELFCEPCWKKIPGYVRRAFNAERDRMRALGIIHTTDVMKECIKMCIITGAQRG